ncbi:MAG: cysteine synthase family protein [Thermoprotei archaeon]
MNYCAQTAFFKGIGNTPTVTVRDTGKLKVYAKLEFANRFGSLKDRPAAWMISKALEDGRLVPGKTSVIEPTSGNTGIALAGLCSSLGLKAVMVVPVRASEETKRKMRELGAEVLEADDDLCPRVGSGTDQAISLAEAYVKSFPGAYVMLDQYSNEANYLSHFETTGPEIWRATQGKITHFIAGVGTGGTLTGVSAYLKSKNPSIKVIGVQPQRNHHVQGLRNLEESATPELLERRIHLVDQWVTVSDEEAFSAVSELADKNRLAVGPSSGAVFAAVEKIGLSEGVAVALFADDASKYGELYLTRGLMGRQRYVQTVEDTARLVESLKKQAEAPQA